jgi:hypothetical protein
MELVRSDSPEVVNSIASTRALACWGWSALTLVSIASAPGLLITLIGSLIVSVRAAAWLGMPVVFALNGYLFWRGRSPRLNWVLAVCANRAFVRLFVRRGKGRADIQEPDVIVFEASEIASMTVRIVEVLLYGPKPRIIERLVIEPAQAIAQACSDHMLLLLKPDNPGKQVYVTNEEGRLTMNWKWCRPDLQTFLQQIARECPSVFIAPEERSEVDLNGIWNGVRFAWRKPDAQQRHLLARAMRLGFGYDCTQLLSRHRGLSFREAGAYLAEIEREEDGTEHDSETQDNAAMQNLPL